MRVLLLGGGGREHAIAWALSRSRSLTELWAAPGSDGMSSLARFAEVDPLNPNAVAGFATRNKIDLVFVGPEAPLGAGVSDAVRTAGIPVFGPSRSAARLETSKAFAKDFMARHSISTARSRACSTAEEAQKAVRIFDGLCAVKADGLAAGKGVVVCGSVEESDAAVDALRATPAGERLIVEERLEGPEVTVMAVVSGARYALLPPSRDHKRLLDGDAGPNTGGMGALCPAPMTADDLQRVEREILSRAVAGLAAEGLDYRGVLYVGIMMTAAGPKALEFNVRFGDPEAQAVLPLLDVDLLEMAAATARGHGPTGVVAVLPGAAVAVVLASPGYPVAPKTGGTISLPEALGDDVLIFHAGTKRRNDLWTSHGGRVLSIVGRGADAPAARTKAYAAIARIGGDFQWRRDIAAVGRSSPA